MVMRNGKDVGGRPQHKPTRPLRRLVQLCATAGCTQEHIAAAVGVSEATLRRHYVRELARARVAIDLLVGQTYLQRMLGGRGTPSEPYNWRLASAPMLIHYVRSRMGWDVGSEHGNDNAVRMLPLGGDFKDI